MKNKLAKSMSMIIAIAMLISMVPAVVSADAATVSITDVTIGEPDNDGFVTVEVEYTYAGLEEYTLLVVRSAEPYETVENGDADLPSGVLPTNDGELEKAIEYIDQESVSADKITFKLRERTGDLVMEDAPYINVLMGGAASAKVYTAKEVKAAPTLTVDSSSFWVGDDVVISYAGDTAAAWEAKELIVKVDGNTVAVKVDDETELPYYQVDPEHDNIIITGLAKGEYDVVEITDADGIYKAATLVTEETTLFEVKSRVAAAKNELWKSEDIKVEELDTDNNNQLDTKKITVKKSVTATSGATIEYTVVTEAIPDVIAIDTTSETETVVTVTRSADAAIDVEISALISYGTEPTETATQKYTANKLGEDGPTVAVLGKVEFANYNGTVFENVYGKTGARVVEIEKGSLDITAYNVVVKGLDGADDVTLFYSPEREKYVGIVFGFIDAATVSTNVDFVAKEATDESKYIYYGFVRDPHKLQLSDFNQNDGMKILQIFNNIEKNPTDAMLITGDVKQNGKLDNNDRMNILQVINGISAKLDVLLKD